MEKKPQHPSVDNIQSVDVDKVETDVIKTDKLKIEGKSFLHDKVWRNAFFFCAGLIVLVFALMRSASLYKAFNSLLVILRPFIAGAALAFLVKIPMNLIEKKTAKFFKGKARAYRRPFALLVSLVLIIFLIALSLRLVVPQLITTVKTLEQRLPVFTNQIISWMKGIDLLEPMGLKIEEYFQTFSWSKTFQQIGDFLTVGKEGWVQKAISTTSAIASGATNSIFAFIFMIYVLLSKERISHQMRRLLYAYLPEKRADRTLYVSHLLHDDFVAFIGGQFLDAVMIAAWTYVGMLVFNIPYKIMITVIMGLTDLIPIIGPLIGTVITTLIILVDSPIQALIFFIYILIAQQIQANIIYPNLVGDRLGLPAMWTLVAITVGGSLLGIVGMWIFLPTFSVIYTLLDEQSQLRIRKKDIRLNDKRGDAIVHRYRAEHNLKDEKEVDKPSLIDSFKKLQNKFRRKKFAKEHEAEVKKSKD